MSERTQMLFQINVMDAHNEMTEEEYAAFHYQNECGRVMPMSALGIVTNLDRLTLDMLQLDKYAYLFEIASAIKEAIVPLASSEHKIDLLADQTLAQKQMTYLAPQNHDFNNTGGFTKLSLTFVQNEAKLAFYEGELNFFAASGSPVTYDEWCKSLSKSINDDWQIGLQASTQELPHHNRVNQPGLYAPPPQSPPAGLKPFPSFHSIFFTNLSFCLSDTTAQVGPIRLTPVRLNPQRKGKQAASCPCIGSSGQLVSFVKMK